MKPFRLIVLAIMLLAGSLTACKQEAEPPLSADLTLRHEGADMPIWLRGNPDAGKIVLYLHGGPGECAMCLRPYFRDLEAKVVVAYWDQRIAGSARGNADPAGLTYVQVADDLRRVVELLHSQYPDMEVYLFAHSFGVEMAWQFLTTGNNQDLVAGAVMLNGTFSTYHWLGHVREWVISQGLAQADTEAVAYMQRHPVTRETMADTVKWGEWYGRMFRLGANPVWPSDDPGYTARLWFKTPHSKLSQMTNVGSYDDYYAREIFTFDRTDSLAGVHIPIGLFWGMKDGIIPPAVGRQTQELLGGRAHWVEFADSWHAAFHTEGEKFTREMLNFLGE